jgi:hypothetical protein
VSVERTAHRGGGPRHVPDFFGRRRQRFVERAQPGGAGEGRKEAGDPPAVGGASYDTAATDDGGRRTEGRKGPGIGQTGQPERREKRGEFDPLESANSLSCLRSPQAPPNGLGRWNYPLGAHCDGIAMVRLRRSK